MKLDFSTQLSLEDLKQREESSNKSKSWFYRTGTPPFPGIFSCHVKKVKTSRDEGETGRNLLNPYQTRNFTYLSKRDKVFQSLHNYFVFFFLIVCFQSKRWCE